MRALFELVDGGQVAGGLVVVQSVPDDELIGYLHRHIVNGIGLLEASLLEEARGDLDVLHIHLRQQFFHLQYGESCVHNVLNDNNFPALNLTLQTHQLLEDSGAFGAGLG